ncbi:DUF5317 domain-containing protein [Effusibacillus lacus]|nr:DUF5317 domain-containing protein [Effusibacillus lacus]TCS76904.1 hypothetical protein EDD64_101128 [Effusibacillus lacus]
MNDGFIIGILVALFRGGKLRDLLDVKLNSLWLIVLAFTVQYAIINLYPFYLFMGVIVSYFSLLLFCLFNRKQPGFYIMMAGIAMNLLVMISNGGRMPVDIEIIRQIAPNQVEQLVAGTIGKHVAMTEQTNLNLLGDIFYLHAPYPREALVSLGDILFSVGVFYFIQKTMVKRRSPIQGSVIHEV